MTAAKPVETDAKGIPLKSSYPEGVSVPVLYSGFTIVFTTIGFLLAYLICHRSSTADAKLVIIATHDLGWLYAGMFLLRLLQLPIGIVLGINRKESKINVPDQHVYKVCGTEGSKLGYVLMESEGILGKFNRAQRALQNYHEQFPTVALQYVASSFVFPFESFICIVIWAVGRCIQAVGYVGSPEGRMKGGLPGIIALNVINGMVLLVAIKTLM